MARTIKILGFILTLPLGRNLTVMTLKKKESESIDDLIGRLFFSHTSGQWDNSCLDKDGTVDSEKAMIGMEKKLFWYRWHIDDWASSTKVEMLTMEEEGIYRRLLDRAWSMPGTALPLDINMLSRLTKNSPIETIQKIIDMFFVKTDEGYVNKRLLKERQESESITSALTKRAKAGADKRWGHKTENNQQVNNQEHAKAMPKQCLSISPSNTQGHAQAMLEQCTDTATDTITDTKTLKTLKPLSGCPDEPPKPQRDKIPYAEIIQYLNEKAESKYSFTAKDTQRHIKARWNEGRTLEDFKLVIENMTAAWGKDAKMINYLRPITLFGTKFESYLNWKKGGNNGRGNGTGENRGNNNPNQKQGRTPGGGIKSKPGEYDREPAFRDSGD